MFLPFIPRFFLLSISYQCYLHCCQIFCGLLMETCLVWFILYFARYFTGLLPVLYSFTLFWICLPKHGMDYQYYHLVSYKQTFLVKVLDNMLLDEKSVLWDILKTSQIMTLSDGHTSKLNHIKKVQFFAMPISLIPIMLYYSALALRL